MLLLSAVVLGMGCRGCGEPVEPEKALETVADEVQFESVTRLGPHQFVATITRTRKSAGQEPKVSDESIEIAWQDWDNFRHRRLAAGELRSASVVKNGDAWSRRLSARFEREDDAEPFRNALRTTWRVWDEALEQFDDRIVLTEVGETVVEGRPARRFEVSLSPPEDEARAQRERQAGLPLPTSLQGFVVIDEATAVRLEIDVTGVLQESSGTRELRVRASRTAIGQVPTILSPPEVRKQRRQTRKEAKAAKAAEAATPGATTEGSTPGSPEQDTPAPRPSGEAVDPLDAAP